jgi:hypothetical protein
LKHVLEENQKWVFTKVFTFYVPALAAGQEQGSCPAGEGEKRAGSGRSPLPPLTNFNILPKYRTYEFKVL